MTSPHDSSVHSKKNAPYKKSLLNNYRHRVDCCCCINCVLLFHLFAMIIIVIVNSCCAIIAQVWVRCDGQKYVATAQHVTDALKEQNPLQPEQNILLIEGFKASWSCCLLVRKKLGLSTVYSLYYFITIMTQ